jgi:hypothetical protein
VGISQRFGPGEHCVDDATTGTSGDVAGLCALRRM